MRLKAQMAATDQAGSLVAEAPRGPRPRSAWRTRLTKLDTKVSPYLYISPFFLLFAGFGLFPLAYTAWISLYSVNLQNVDERTWVGFDNYTRLFHDDQFWNAVQNTITIGLISTVPQLLIALGLAHLLHCKLRGSTFFRVSLLMPYATSVAAATIVFAMLFGRDFGLVNWFLGVFGVDNIDWENGKWSSQIAISTIVTWRWTGYNALIYLAAMQAIPKDLYEAAEVDGASRWQQLRHVTIPGIKPTIIFTVIISTIGAMQLFGEPLLFGGAGGYRGGADHQYQTLGLLLYEQGWFNFQLGRAAATAWTMFLIIMVAVAVNALLASKGRSVFTIGRRRRRGVTDGARTRVHGRPQEVRAEARRRHAARGRSRTRALIGTTILAIIPLYWTVVAASRTNADIAKTPPPLTPGDNLWSNIRSGARPGRHGQGAAQLAHRLGLDRPRHGLLLHARRVRVRQAALPREQRAARASSLRR